MENRASHVSCCYESSFVDGGSREIPHPMNATVHFEDDIVLLAGGSGEVE